MRCPNCGNENPQDYVFCDECGARLQPLADMGQGDSAGGVAAGGADMDNSMGGIAGAVGADGGAGSADIPSWQPSGAIDSGDAAGAGSAGGDAASIWDSQSAMSGDAMPSGPMGSAGMASAGGEGAHAGSGQDSWTYGSGSGSSIGAESDEEAPLIPATEDTIGAGMGGGAMMDGDGMMASTAAGDSGVEMPGVVPIGGIYGESSGSGSSYGMTGGGHDSEWSSAAMRYLEEAQRALDNLRRHLGSAGAGMGAEAGAGAASGMGGGFAQSDMSMGSGSSMSGGGAAMPTDMGDLGAGTGGSMGATSGDAGGYGTIVGIDEAGGYNPDSSMGAAGTDSMAPSMGGSSADMVYGSGSAPDLSGMPGMGGGAGVGVPTLEPDAEAGNLGGGAGMDTGMGAGLGDTGGAMIGAGAGGGTIGSTTAQEAPAESGAPVMARLVLIATGAEMPIPEQEEITVGREDPSSGIFPDIDLTPYGGEDGGVSRRHAKLLRIGDDFFVEDLQSTNYTKLDGQRLPAHVRERIEDGARIDFGRVATIFRRS
jgi:hypothetical protein